MKNSEKFIKDYTKGCSNQLGVGWNNGESTILYHEWLTPDQAKTAVEIDRRELINYATNWLSHHSNLIYNEIQDFRKAMESFEKE